MAASSGSGGPPIPPAPPPALPWLYREEFADDPPAGMMADSRAGSTAALLQGGTPSYELVGAVDTLRLASASSEYLQDATVSDLADGSLVTAYLRVYMNAAQPDGQDYPPVITYGYLSWGLIGWNANLGSRFFRVRVRQSNLSYKYVNGPVYTENTWLHVWLRIAPATAGFILTVDGTDYAIDATWDGTFTTPSAGAHLVLGREGVTGAAYTDANYDRVIIWKTSVPDAAERAAIEAGGAPTTAPLRIYPFDPLVSRAAEAGFSEVLTTEKANAYIQNGIFKRTAQALYDTNVIGRPATGQPFTLQAGRAFTDRAPDIFSNTPVGWIPAAQAQTSAVNGFATNTITTERIRTEVLGGAPRSKLAGSSGQPVVRVGIIDEAEEGILALARPTNAGWFQLMDRVPYTLQNSKLNLAGYTNTAHARAAVLDLDAWASYATARVDGAVPDGQTFTHSPDFLAVYTITGISNAQRFQFREASASNACYVQCQNNGRVAVILWAGTPSTTLLSSDTGKAAPGDTVIVLCIGRRISVWTTTGGIVHDRVDITANSTWHDLTKETAGRWVDGGAPASNLRVYPLLPTGTHHADLCTLNGETALPTYPSSGLKSVHEFALDHSRTSLVNTARLHGAPATNHIGIFGIGSNTPLWEGTALRFIDDYVDLYNAPIGTGASGFHLFTAFHLYTDPASIISTILGPQTSRGIQVRIANGKIEVLDAGQANVLTSTGSITGSGKHTVEVSFDGVDAWTICIDGGTPESQTAAYTFPANGLNRIGAYHVPGEFINAVAYAVVLYQGAQPSSRATIHSTMKARAEAIHQITLP